MSVILTLIKVLKKVAIKEGKPDSFMMGYGITIH